MDWLQSGGAAGTSVDVVLFPLDTLKTRLQSSQGFIQAGGFRGLYAGLGPAFLGSAPGAAMFFASYEAVKNILKPQMPPHLDSLSHMMAASFGEITACLVRVPIEVIKQRAQTSAGLSSFAIFRNTLKYEKFRGLYRGFTSTIAREVPFSIIQFPLWEHFKLLWSEYQNEYVQPWQASLCGAIAGGIAAGITTPIDVAKTRIMLAQKGSEVAKGNIIFVLRNIYSKSGIKGLFSGILPRVMWISLGGAIFLGVYEKLVTSFSSVKS